MPIENEYSLRDLADVAGVTPRTVRYYIAQGLLPAPEGAGTGARYGDGHLARLRLIGQLQKQHLPLAEIRARLSGLDDSSVIAILGQPEPKRASESALDYIRSLVAPTDPPDLPPYAMARALPSANVPLMRSMSFGAEPAAPAASIPPPPPPPSTAKPTLERSQWDRIELAPDVELHIRRPLGRLQNKRVERLITIARQLLEEDPS